MNHIFQTYEKVASRVLHVVSGDIFKKKLCELWSELSQDLLASAM